MNRKQFLKRLGIGAVAVVVAPKVIAETPEKKFVVRYLDAKIGPLTWEDEEGQTYKPWHQPSPEEIIQIWKQTGDLILKVK